MTELTTNNNFVKPYPQPALGGKLGLTHEDIAKSLGLSPHHIRDKFTQRDMLNRLQSRHYEVAVEQRANKTNGLPYDVYIMVTEAAKFVVAKHQSPIADDYVAYLVNLSTGMEEMEELAKTNPQVAQAMFMTELAVKQAKLEKRFDELAVDRFKDHCDVLEIKAKVDAIKVRGRRLPVNYPIPHDYMRTDEIYKKLFDGIGLKHIRKILIESGIHPQRVLIKRDDGTEFYTMLYLREEVVRVSNQYEETREIMKEHPKVYEWDHHIIGPHFTKKIKTRKPPKTIKQNLINFGDHKSKDQQRENG